MHGLLPADIPRRILSLAAAAVVPVAAAAVLVLAAPAQAQPGQPGQPVQTAQPGQSAQSGRVSIVIDSMTPQTAKPGSTVTVAGTVTNGTSQTKAGLDVQLWTSSNRFQTRDEMDGYVSQGTGASLEEVGDPFSLAASLRPGATVQWHASFQVNTVGMDQFGVYPVSAQLGDGEGDVLGVDQTLLPFWPGQQAAGLERPLDIAWVWPLVDQPHHQVCSALTSNDLTTSLAPGGRLSALLGAGQANPGAHVTWVVDPALLSDVNTMTKPYQVASGPGCGAVNKPASKAAKTWLGTLRGITAGQTPVITPYANVDVSALVHSGLAPDITSAYSMGYAVADSVLHGSFGPTIAVPAGGTADLSVLTNLATAQHIGAAVLDSSEMPPANSAGFEPDDAVTSIRTPSGVNMTILLADHVLTGVLAAGDTSSGVLPPSTQFTVTQRFLAETAMIAAEAPDSDRSIVVDPPENWSPSATLASDLLSQTASTPWLSPTALGSLAGAPDSEHNLARQRPPASKDSPGELTGSYLSTVAETGIELGVYQDLLYQPSNSYVQGLQQALTATESSAWRGRGAAQGLRPGRQAVRVHERRGGPDPYHRRAAGTDGRLLRPGPGVHPERLASRHPGPAQDQRGQRAGPDLPAEHRALPEPDHGPAPASADHPAAGELGADRGDRHPAEPHHRAREGAAAPADLAHGRVDQVRPRDLVPHRRRDRHSRPHLGVPRRPAADARRHPGCPRRCRSTG